MNVLWLTNLFCLGFGAGTGDIDHGQQAEHQGLHKAGEEIEIQRKYRRDTECEDGNTGKDPLGLQSTKDAQHRHDNAKDQHDRLFLLGPKDQKQCAHRHQYDGNCHTAGSDGIQHQRRNQTQGRVQNAGDDTAAGHITKMTQSHGGRLGHLGHDVHGIDIILQEAAKAVLFNVVSPNDHTDHDGPYQRNAEVRGGRAKKTGQTDERRTNGAEEDGADQGQIVGIVLTHGVADHVVEHHHALFHQNLLAVGPFFQSLAKVNKAEAQQKRYHKARDRGLSDIDATQDRDGEIDIRAGDIDIHSFNHPF